MAEHEGFFFSFTELLSLFKHSINFILLFLCDDALHKLGTSMGAKTCSV